MNRCVKAVRWLATSRNTIVNQNWQCLKRKVYAPLSVSQHHFATVPPLPPAKVGRAASSDEQRDFVSIFPDVVRDLLQQETLKDVPDALKWLSKVMQYNVRGGKMNRGLAVGMSYKLLAKPEDLTKDNIRRAHVLGWCIEMLQSYFLISDDMIDGSDLRRGKPAWHRANDRGLAAISDAILLEAALYSLIDMHCADQPYYTDVLRLFHSVTLKTALGQTLDLMSCDAEGRPRLDRFTMERYNAIVRYKTGYYSFYLPVATAMYMSGIKDPELHRQARTILLQMGAFFQVQDDYLDAFGDSAVTGKAGSDVAAGKCTWLVVVALQRASAAQREVLQRHYGAGGDSVAVVTKLYEELGLPATYRQYEDSTSALIRMHIQQISAGLNHKVFFKFLDKIHRREH